MNDIEKGKRLSDWYDKNYKTLIAISFTVTLVTIGYLIFFYFSTGDIMYKDVSLSGGTILTVNSGMDISPLEKSLPEGVSIRKLSELNTGKQIAFIIETNKDINEIKPLVEKYLGYTLTEENSSIEFTGSSLSESFYKELRNAMLIAFVLMAIVIFFLFRTFIPAIAVIQAAVTDILVPLAVLDLMGFKVSGAGIAALLMLIGYSVDTDIMLTNRALRKRELKINDRIWNSFLTGITMTLTSLIAVLIAFFVVRNISSVLTEIFMILSLGLIVDIFSTWLGNAGLLKWYCEKKKIY
ncbi:MAG: hypothetical protein V1660_04750 [archaeon]